MMSQFMKFALPLILLSCQAEKKYQVRIFQPGNISSEAIEYGPAFSSDGTELYFARSKGEWGKGNLTSSIYYSIKQNDTWAAPEIAPFSGEFDDSDPHLTADGQTLYFISTRPSDGAKPSQDIWKISKQPDGTWGNPVRFPDPVNSPDTEYSPKTDQTGQLYFASDRPGGFGQGDIYQVSLGTNGALTVQNLGIGINSPTGEWNLEISDKGDIIIFEASQRPQNKSPYGDLYISFQQSGNWTIPQAIEELNTTGSDLSPELTQNSRHLYFASSDSLKSKTTQLYHIDFQNLMGEYRRKSSLPDSLNNKIDQPVSPNSLVLDWVCSGPFEQVESVVIDHDHSALYASNGKAYRPGTAGFISKLSLDGTLDNLKWVEGLNRPTGMAIHKGLLYVADFNALVIINTLNGQVLKKINAPVANPGLNDVTVNDQGEVFVTASSIHGVYKLEEDKLTLYAQDDQFLKYANGIETVGEQLMVAGMTICTIEGNSQKINPYNTSPVVVDFEGISTDPEGGFFFSTVENSALWYLNKQQEITLLKDADAYFGDLEYSSELHRLFVARGNHKEKKYYVESYWVK